MDLTSSRDLSKRNLGLDSAVAVGLAGAVLFFLLSGAVAVFNLRSLREGNERVVQTHQAIVARNQMLSSVQDAETGQRGFHLPNDEAYLGRYNAA